MSVVGHSRPGRSGIKPGDGIKPGHVDSIGESENRFRALAGRPAVSSLPEAREELFYDGRLGHNRRRLQGTNSPTANAKYRSRSALLHERASKLVSGSGELTTGVEPTMIGCET
jgi:hypothetical protein